MRRFVGVVVALVLAVSVASCGEGDGSVTTVASRPAVSPAVVSTTAIGISTHCGIQAARIGSTRFVATPVLSDGNGNPPAGWDNPTQDGTMTVYADGTALFDDGRGHVAWFRTASAGDPTVLCQ